MTPPLLVPGLDPDAVVDSFVASSREDEFCVSPYFDPAFAGELAYAGFLIMSARVADRTLLLPKIHVERSVLDFPDIREPKSSLRLIPRYELRPNADFRAILENCAAAHGDEWLTEDLRQLLATLNDGATRIEPASGGPAGVKFVSFALYRKGKLVAGEFGSVVGSVYTSYSGYRSENSAGTVQLILTGRYLRDAGFAFWDLGMPIDYKTRLGAWNVPREEFVRRFRDARDGRNVAAQTSSNDSSTTLA